ncbi:hypothetical protein [Candidatus Nitrospira bockiana]
MSLHLHARLGSLLALLLIVSACSSKGPQYPEDHARYVRLDEAVEALRQAYVRKDLSAVEALVLPSNATDRLVSDIRKDFDQFQEMALDFAIERVVIDGDQIDVFLHWQGQWKAAPSEARFRERGHGVLRWTGMQSILLAGVGGDVPFGMATRRPVPQAPHAPAS